jgi:hypothetical protein
VEGSETFPSEESEGRKVTFKHQIWLADAVIGFTLLLGLSLILATFSSALLP